eukprot:56819-Amphidinium_carterae.1
MDFSDAVVCNKTQSSGATLVYLLNCWSLMMAIMCFLAVAWFNRDDQVSILRFVLKNPPAPEPDEEALQPCEHLDRGSKEWVNAAANLLAVMLFGMQQGDCDSGDLTTTPHHQHVFDIIARADGLLVPVTNKPCLAHVQKFVYPDKEKDEFELNFLRPYRYFACIMNAYPCEATLSVMLRLVKQAFDLMGRRPAEYAITELIPKTLCP